MSYEKCVVSLGATLKGRGFDNHSELASSMCSTWATENGVEREFGRTLKEGDKRRTFALSIGETDNISFTEEEGVEAVTFPVIAITSGPHEYTEDDIQQKVYIEPEVLRENIESFKELPIYLNHQRTSDDLIGMAANPEVFEMDNGMTAIKMLAQVDNKTESGKEVLEKVKEGEMTHVSIDWFSNDVDVMGDTFATNIRPTEVSFIDNKTMDPVCKECTIGNGNCESHTPDDKHDCGCGGHEGACECTDGKQEVINMTENVEKTPVKSEAENIVEREFASLRSQLDEVSASNVEIKSQYEEALKTIESFKLAEEERATKEAEARKVEKIEAIISKEILFGTIEEDKKETRVEVLTAWDEPRLTGFSEALAAMPVPEETERTFGKGKSNESEELSPSETERQFAVKMDEKTGRFKINPEVLRRGN